MSRNYPYRVPPPDTDIRTGRLDNVPADRRRPAGVSYGAPQASYPSSYPPAASSSARSLAVPQDVLAVLSSCGLEPDDLARLAELPEDVLTVESLPHILQQMKCKRGMLKPFTSTASTFSSPTSSSSSSSSSYSSSASQHPGSASRPPASWDRLRSQPVQYPTISSTRVPDHWGTPRTRADPSSSPAGHMVPPVDMALGAGASVYGKTGPAASFSAAGRGQNSGAARFSNPALSARPAPPPPRPPPPPRRHPPANERRRGQRGSAPSSSSRSSRLPASSPAAPTKTQAVDFHGSSPTVFPHTCSLCDITVLSQKVWIQHVNSTQHADGQLNLLQEFPKWDCRIESAISAEDQSEGWKDDRHPAPPARASKKNQASQDSKTSQKKTSDQGKVVCVKFPSQSVDETYLRKLTEPFGKVVKILMFSSLAFVELGSADQAKDLVKFHSNYPPTVNGEQMEFSVSNTFNFLQSSQVLSFTPAPTGRDGLSDLISIVKRFGAPLYTLFLPSKVFVEMTTVPEAQKLVDYYSSKVLRLNDDCIKVAFSGEYKSLAQVPSARRYREEEPRSSKRARSSSQEQEGRRRKSRRSRSRSKERKTRTRSRSKERKTRTRSRSKEKTRTRSRSKERKTRTRSRSKEKSAGDKRTRSGSRSREEPSKETRSESGSKGNPSEPQKPAQLEATAAPAPVVDSKPAEQEVQVKMEEEEEEEDEDERLSDDNSDIEGMEVIAEDGEEVEDEDEEEEEQDGEAEEDPSPEEETQSAENGDAAKEEEEQQEEEEEELGGQNQVQEKTQEQDKEEEPEETSEIRQEDDEEEEKEEEEEEKEEQKEEEEEEEDEGFPLDLENCITLDELVEEECEEPDEEEPDEEECEEPGEKAASRIRPSCRVLYISNLPPRFYTDAEFIAVVREFGTAVRYLLLRNTRKGFIEMSRSSDASRAAKELRRRTVSINHAKLIVKLSDKYDRLTDGWPVQQKADEERRSRRSERGGRSTSSEQDKKERSCKGRAEKRSPEKQSAAAEAPEETPESGETPQEEARPRKESPEKTSTPRETPQEEAQKHNTSKSPTTTSTGAAEETPTPTVRQKEEAQPRKESPEDETAGRDRSPHDERSPQEEEEEVPEEQSLKRDAPPDETAPPTAQKTEGTETAKESEERIPEAAEEENKGGSMDSEASGDPKRDEVKSAEAENAPVEEPAEVSQAPPPKPSKPVGAEFVRPVVGYFCNLCQLIFADEDEAKQDHCSTAAHYSRYQEKTGKDPWAS